MGSVYVDERACQRRRVALPGPRGTRILSGLGHPTGFASTAPIAACIGTLPWKVLHSP